jgi:hypothetical protein
MPTQCRSNENTLASSKMPRPEHWNDSTPKFMKLHLLLTHALASHAFHPRLEALRRSRSK